MCYGCYEAHGKPEIQNERTLRAAVLVEAVYAFAPAGGHCHIVLDDFNIEDDHIDFCINEITSEPREMYTTGEIDIQLACMESFRAMTLEERASALAIYEGWI